MRHLRIPALLAILFLALPPATRAQAAAETACTTCHADTDLFEDDAARVVTDFGMDVHAEVAISCHDCHGGNPNPELAEDMFGSKDEKFEENPYVGAPDRTDVPSFCGRCHSDPTYMKRFKPDARIDQEAEYWTSQHGKALLAGDSAVATCIDCHGVHGIQRTDAPESSVYPTNVAGTCDTCHGNADLMEDRRIPIDQYARWRRSVHASAMFDKEDLSAPTCNDCHGNHGASPPGLDSVVFVCGQCHGREADLYRASPKHAGMEEHNEFMADAGEESCAACHEEPAASVQGITAFGECTTCHGNHGTVRPSMAMFGTLPEVPCSFCHESPNGVQLAALESERTRLHYEEVRDRLLAQAQRDGLAGEDEFNWMVDRAATLPEHSIAGNETADGLSPLRPEFARLFDKFRIGKTYYTYEDPETGEEVQTDIVRCNKCHGSAESGEVGAETVAIMVDGIRELTAMTGRAERLLLQVKRGGVETREALLDIDQAIDAGIGLQVLVHTFSTFEDGPFVEQQAVGLEHANAALAKGREGVAELAFRRRGLAVALVFIFLVLIGLAAKIREISRREGAMQA